MRFELLDALRGFAAVWVLAYHFHFSPTFHASLPFLSRLARVGYYGVELFFVISGYCIVAAAAKAQSQGTGIGRFLKRRLLRIYPPFWASIALVAALPYLQFGVLRALGRSADWPQPLFAQFTTVDWLSVAALIPQAYRFPDVPLNEKFETINVVYWSLALEVQFYLAVALSMLLKRGYLAVLFASGLVAIPLCWNGLPAGWNTGLFLPYWTQFLLGGLLFVLHRQGWSLARWPSHTSAIVGALLAAAITAGIVWQFQQGGRFHSLTFSALVALALWGLLPVEGALHRSSLNWKRWLWPWFSLGAMSYSIYLIHFNLHKLPRMIVARLLPENSLVCDALILIATVLLVVPFYWLCDRPFAVPGALPAVRWPWTKVKPVAAS